MMALDQRYRTMTYSFPPRLILCAFLLVVSIQAFLPEYPRRDSIVSLPPDRPIKILASLDNRLARSSTALSMGIRSILGFGKGKKNQDETDDDSDSIADSLDSTEESSDDAATSEAASPSQGKSTSTRQSPLRMGEDPQTKTVNVHKLDRESVQERINRVKSGQMTEDEKQAFLRTALSAGATPESRPPLRGPEAKKKKRVFASPFPTDSILRNFARGKPEPDLDSMQKKRDYLNMVTDPDRFQWYKNYGQGRNEEVGVGRISGSVSASSKTPISDIRDISRKTKDDNVTPPPPTQPPQSTPDNLGARLGAAALVNENMRQQAELERKERQQRLEQERRDYEKRAAEIARRRQLEVTNLELQTQDRRRTEREKQEQKELEKKQAEEARLMALQRAQDEFWAKKLASERKAKAKREHTSTAEQNETTGQGSAAEEEPAPEVEAEPEIQTPIVNGQAVFNPDESVLLDMAKFDYQNDWDKNQAIMEYSAASASGQRPLASHMQHEPDFLEEQARQKEQIDRVREEQLIRLKELSSPLPSPVTPEPTYMQRNRPTPGAPLFGSAYDQKSYKDTDPMRGVNLNPPARDSVRISKADVELEDNAQLENTAPSPAPAKRNIPSPPAWSNFFSGGNKKASPSPKPAPASKPASQGPIRMKLPLGGDDEEGGVDVKANSGMSVADAMKRTTQGGNQSDRSKKWGIDMSRFTD